MNRALQILAAFSATPLAAPAATLLLDSKDHASLVTASSQATFGAQSFQLSIAGAGTNDTVAANSPLPATAMLNSITFVKAPSGAATTGSIYVKLFTGSADAAGTPVAVSTNSIDINSTTALTDLVWSFSGESLATTTVYYAVFSSNREIDATGTDGVGGRVAAANFGAGFNGGANPGLVYGGSDALLRGWNATNPPVSQNLDARFSVSFDIAAVPEPSAALLGGLGLLAMLRRRRV